MTDYSLKVVKPITVTDAMLISTDVPETDHLAWSSGTTYAKGDRVTIVSTNTHLVYESLQAANSSKPPASEPTWWLKVGPTNRWKMFDTSNSTQTAKASTMSYRLRPGYAISTVGILNITGVTSIRVRLIDSTFGTVYDETRDVSAAPGVSDWYSWFFGIRSAPLSSVFLNIPSFPSADIYVDFTGTVDMAVGVLLFGQTNQIGVGIDYGAKVGIQDYSRKETNLFGDTVLTKRAFARRSTFSMKVPNEYTDSVYNILSDLRSTPCLWIGSSIYESTIVYGFYKDFDISISYPTFSDCTLEIEGLT